MFATKLNKAGFNHEGLSNDLTSNIYRCNVCQRAHHCRNQEQVEYLYDMGCPICGNIEPTDSQKGN